MLKVIVHRRGQRVAIVVILIEAAREFTHRLTRDRSSLGRSCAQASLSRSPNRAQPSHVYLDHPIKARFIGMDVQE